MISKNHEVYKHKHICLVEEHQNPLGIVRSLGEEGIKPIVLLCAHNPVMVNNSKYVGELHIFNTIQEGFDFLMEHYSNEPLKPFIYNGSDNVTLLLDEHYEELKDKFYFTNGQGGIEKYLQKYDITQAAVECGINIPKEELLQVGEMPKTLIYPVFTKAVTSSTGGNWKALAHICENEDELKAAYKTMKSDKILVQEFIKKENELCIDGISINGGEQVFMPYACHYYRMTKDSFGNYMYFFPFRDSELIDKITELIRKTKFTGIFCIEFLVDKQGEHYFLEVNYRNSGWSYFFTYGGFNLPFRWAVSTLDNKLYLDEFTPKEKFNCMDEVPDMMDCLKKLRGVSFMQWLKDFHHSDSVLLWNKDDMKPALVYWGRRFIYFPIHKIQKILGFKK